MQHSMPVHVSTLPASPKRPGAPGPGGRSRARCRWRRRAARARRLAAPARPACCPAGSAQTPAALRGAQARLTRRRRQAHGGRRLTQTDCSVGVAAAQRQAGLGGARSRKLRVLHGSACCHVRPYRPQPYCRLKILSRVRTWVEHQVGQVGAGAGLQRAHADRAHGRAAGRRAARRHARVQHAAPAEEHDQRAAARGSAQRIPRPVGVNLALDQSPTSRVAVRSVCRADQLRSGQQADHRWHSRGTSRLRGKEAIQVTCSARKAQSLPVWRWVRRSRQGQRAWDSPLELCGHRGRQPLADKVDERSVRLHLSSTRGVPQPVLRQDAAAPAPSGCPHIYRKHTPLAAHVKQLSDARRCVCRAGGRTATSGLGRSDSHCSPVSTSTADRPMTTTSARDCDELASATGATCRAKTLKSTRLHGPCALAYEQECSLFSRLLLQA
jgi:hypothetical protein